MAKKNGLDKLVPVVKYECPVCKESFVTERECSDHLRNHDEIRRTVYIDREDNGEFKLKMDSARPVPPDWARKHSKPVKSTILKDHWYMEAQDDPDSIAKAKKELIRAAREWYRSGLSQLEALETGTKQKEKQDDNSK